MIIIVGAAYLFTLARLLRRDALKTLAALAVATLIGGLLYWTIPYSKMGSGFFWIAFGCLGLIAGLAITRRIRLVWPKTAGTTGLGFVTAVMARAVYDAVRDPTSHNLFFVEVTIAFIFGFLGASIATLGGRIFRRREVGPIAEPR